LVSVVCWALLLTGYSVSINAQTVDPVTGNLINYGNSATDTTSKWNNGVYVNTICFQAGQAGNCGPNPSIRPGGNINFSYGTTDLNQVVNINRALAAGGSGVQLSGFNFGFTAKNGNGWDDGRQDYLSAYVKFYDAGGGQAASYDYTSQTNRKYNWTNFNFSETFANPVAASNYSNAQVGFVGRDNNYWAGNYGPEINDVSFSLKYKVDPCSSNPAYSPTCAGFSSIATSGNLLNSNLMSNGNVVYNSFAVNTALKSSGAGVEVYGFNYGYNYSLGNGTYGCTATNQDGSCSWYMNTNPTAQVRVRLTDSSNNVIYSAAQSRSTPNTAENVSYQFLLPSTTNSLSLGTFTMGASTTGNAAIQNMYANALYKPDPCVKDPLSSASCPGYATAYAKNLILGSTVASASAPSAPPAPAAAAPALAQAAPALADPAQPQQQTQQTAQAAPAQQGPAPAPGQDPNQNPGGPQDNPSQPSPQQAGPAPTQPQPAGGPPQVAQSAPPPGAGPQQNSGPQQAGPSGGGAGPSKLAMSVVKTAQANDKATQQMAVQQAAKAFEATVQSSNAISNALVSMNQDMSANSATAAANFASQSTQASAQTSTQITQGVQQTQQVSLQQQSNKSVQLTQQTQEVQQTQQQQTSSDFAQLKAPQQTVQQETQTIATSAKPQAQQAQQTQQSQQSQTVASVVQLQPPQQVVQQVETQPVATIKMQTPQVQETQQSQMQSVASTVQVQPPVYTPPAQQETQSTSVVMLKQPMPVETETQQQFTGTGITVSRNTFSYNPFNISNASSNQSLQVQTSPVYQPRLQERVMEVETPPMQIASFGGVGKAGNPLNDMMQQRFELMQENIQQQTSTVNRNVQPNDLAVGVDLASMATTPAGFNAYSFALKDTAFYEPKEVYKNQKTVDNVRLLRGLTGGSDRLHQEMIDQQYK